MDQSKRAVLIIEDNREFLEATAELLQLSNYRVYTADNGQSGIQKARIHKPDVILCDIVMGDLNGYQVLTVLSRDEATANIPFIFLTSLSQWADVRKGMEMGADDYLIKPYDEHDLLGAIEARLQKHERIIKSAVSLKSLESLVNEARAAKLIIDLSEGRRFRQVKKKQKIYLEGDLPENVYFLKNGKIRTYQISDDGREMVTGIYGSGDFFGYEAALLNKPSCQNAEAIDDSELYLLPRNEFHTLLFKDIRIARKFIELLSGNVVEKQEQLVQLAYNTVRKRVADALIRLSAKFSSTEQPEIKITRDGLAAMVGTAIETVSRTLSDLREEKIIEKEGSNIRILSPERLKQIR